MSYLARRKGALTRWRNLDTGLVVWRMTPPKRGRWEKVFDFARVLKLAEMRRTSTRPGGRT